MIRNKRENGKKRGTLGRQGKTGKTRKPEERPRRDIKAEQRQTESKRKKKADGASPPPPPATYDSHPVARAVSLTLDKVELLPKPPLISYSFPSTLNQQRAQ